MWLVLGLEGAGRPPYPGLTRALHAAGFVTAGMHVRGTGLSSGPRGDVTDFALALSDYRLYLEHLQSRFARIFLLGQSAGAAFALELAASTAVALAGIVLVNPAWRLTRTRGMGPSLGDYGRYAANCLFRRSVPTVDMNANPGAIAFPPDREEAEAMRRDPTVVRWFSIRALLGLRRVMRRCGRNIARAKAPLLLVQGAHDALVDPASYEALLRLAAVEDKGLIVAPAGGHGSSAVESSVEPIVRWLVAHKSSG
ncbi:MAG: alpha/beta fold hydrolase [Gemmatimonadetes bacterium]|nr:alpha/beta fold hydrolase [Gemmatimonadota bacterium]